MYKNFQDWLSIREDTATQNTDPASVQKKNLMLAKALPRVTQSMPNADVTAAQKTLNVVQADPKIPVDSAPDVMKATEKLMKQKPQPMQMKKLKK